MKFSWTSRWLLVVLGLLFIFSSMAFSQLSPPPTRPETQLVVLCYHLINPGKKNIPYTLSPKQFEDQLDALTAQGYRFVSLQEVDNFFYHNKPLPPKAAVITFDDGNRSTYTNAYPILRARNIPWTLFIYPTGIYAGPKRGFMSWSEVKEVAENGATIGCHSYWHPRLTDYAKEPDPDSWLNKQIAESRKLIEKRIGKPVQAFAIPFGLWDRNVADKLREAGYRLVFNINNTNNNKDSDPMDLSRQIIGANESVGYFTSRITPKRLSTASIGKQNLSIVETPELTLRISIPNADKYKPGEVFLREPRWGTINLTLTNGQVEVPVKLTQPGQYIPHVYARTTSGEKREASWSFVYRKRKS